MHFAIYDIIYEMAKSKNDDLIHITGYAPKFMSSVIYLTGNPKNVNYQKKQSAQGLYFLDSNLAFYIPVQVVEWLYWNNML